MKNIMQKLGGVLIPVILCIALIVTAFMSIESIEDLKGNARVINYTGIVRGATQRLIKKELNHVPDDELITRLDTILNGLSNGSKELNLVKLEDRRYQSLISEMQDEWEDLKEEIRHYRAGDSEHDLYGMSEAYFELADETVNAAEVYTEQIVHDARKSLIVMNAVFILIAVGCTIYSLYQERRRSWLIEIEKENQQKSEHLSKRLQELLVPMNEVSELMYVTDIDTYELLFINDSGKRTFQVDDDGIGTKKCYQILQGLDSPCPFCTTPFLKEDETYSWEYTNPITQKHYLLKDRLIEWKGQTARMEIAFDNSEAENEKNELKKRLERDNILVDCIRELYRNHDILCAITDVLQRVGELFFADRAYIFLFQDDRFSNIAEWCGEGVEAEIDNLQNLPKSDFGLWFDLLSKQDKILIPDVKKLKETMPKGYELLDGQGIHSTLWVPLEKDNELNGCIGLDNYDIRLVDSAVPFLQTIQYFITLAMQRNENEKTLFELSYMDKLTTFFNRNRYMQDISELEKSHEPTGVVYLDVNGLKEVNDRYGHDRGDSLLKTFADIVKNTFEEGNMYRIGGDEFVIICTNISEPAFRERVRKLRGNIEESGCRAAVGCTWDEDSENIQNIIKSADGEMYADKKRFYQNHHATDRFRHN